MDAHVISAQVKRLPAAAKLLARFASCTAPREDVHHLIARIGQEFDEKLRQCERKAGRMRPDVEKLAQADVVAVTFAVRELQ